MFIQPELCIRKKSERLQKLQPICSIQVFLITHQCTYGMTNCQVFPGRPFSWAWCQRRPPRPALSEDELRAAETGGSKGMLVWRPGRCWAGCPAFGSFHEMVDVVHVDQLRKLDVNEVNEMVHRVVNDGKFELPLGALGLFWTVGWRPPLWSRCWG